MPSKNIREFDGHCVVVSECAPTRHGAIGKVTGFLDDCGAFGSHGASRSRIGLWPLTLQFPLISLSSPPEPFGLRGSPVPRTGSAPREVAGQRHPCLQGADRGTVDLVVIDEGYRSHPPPAARAAGSADPGARLSSHRIGPRREIVRPALPRFRNLGARPWTQPFPETSISVSSAAVPQESPWPASRPLVQLVSPPSRAGAAGTTSLCRT